MFLLLGFPSHYLKQLTQLYFNLLLVIDIPKFWSCPGCTSNSHTFVSKYHQNDNPQRPFLRQFLYYDYRLCSRMCAICSPIWAVGKLSMLPAASSVWFAFCGDCVIVAASDVIEDRKMSNDFRITIIYFYSCVAWKHISWTWTGREQQAFAQKTFQAKLSHSITKTRFDLWAEEFDTDSFGRLKYQNPQPCCYSWS